MIRGFKRLKYEYIVSKFHGLRASIGLEHNLFTAHFNNSDVVLVYSYWCVKCNINKVE